MSKEKQIEFIDYEQDRLMFFVNELSLAQRKYDRLFKTFKDAPYMSEGAVFLSDAGREVQFYKDVVEMLDKGYRKHEWISVEDWLPEFQQDVLVCDEIGDVFTDHLERDGKWNKEISRRWGIKYLYWMPLPEAPKGGANNDS